MIEARFQLDRPGFSLDAAFTLPSPQLTAFFGHSGSGKTTLLRCMAGLERVARGRLVVDGETWQDERKWLPPHRRQIGYVFQDSSLFPHLTVQGNLCYGMRRADGASPMSLDEVVELLGIAHLLGRKANRLSGGERQRVAIGRALLSKPRLLLMDEPLASLDIERKREILPYIEMLRDRLSLPIIYVSHAVDEVARLASHVLVIEQGRIIASGPPDRALRPHINDGDTRFERVSVLTGLAGPHDSKYGLTSVLHPAGRITIAGHLAENRETRIVIRATDVTLATQPPQNLSVRTALAGTVAAIERGEAPAAIVTVTLQGGQQLEVSATRKAIDELQIMPGTPVWCLIKSVSIDERWLPGA